MVHHLIKEEQRSLSNQEDMQETQDSEQILRTEESWKLTDIPITKGMVEKETNRQKKIQVTRVLQEYNEVVSELLALVFMMLLESGEVLWRQANVVPILKKEDKTLVSNNGSVSLTSMAQNIREQNLITTQHSFMEGKWCLTNLLNS